MTQGLRTTELGEVSISSEGGLKMYELGKQRGDQTRWKLRSSVVSRQIIIFLLECMHIELKFITVIFWKSKAGST